jgi:hypothetical protein
MKNSFGIKTKVVVAICAVIGLFLWLGVGASAFQKEKKPLMTTHASGTFDVKMTPQTADDKGAASAVGRFSLDKQFHGDLAGTSKGEMLAISGAVAGSAGYVAMEQVTGTLNGRTGTFALQHTGTMTRGAAQLSINVVPDSGTGELTGLSGKMDIKIAEGKHFYEFDYTLAPAP